MAFIPADLAAAKALAPFLGGLAVAAAGFGGAEVYEHTAPWGLEHQRDAIRAGIPALEATAAKSGAAQQAAADGPVFAKWGASLAECQAAQKSARDAQAAAIAAGDHFTSTQAAAAYRLGRSTCNIGAPNAPPPPGSSPVAGPGGVPDAPDDFADAFGAGPPPAAP